MPDADFTLFGVSVALSMPAELAELARSAVPAAARHAEPGPRDLTFSLDLEDDLVLIERDGQPGPVRLSPDAAAPLLAERLLDAVADHASDLVFVRGAAVERDGYAIVLPAGSVSGTTTLHDALVAAGATSLGDGVVGFDPEGHVRSPHDESAVPVAVVAAVTYRPGATWEPEQPTAGAGALALLAHERGGAKPDALLPALGRVTDGTVVLEGERGEASVCAAALLRALPPASPAP